MFKSLTANLSPGGLPASFRTDPGAPVPIRRATRLMYAGAAVSAISLLLSVISAFNLKSALIAANAQQIKDHKVTMSQINSIATANIVFAIVIGVAAVALWIWMGKMCGLGRSWARISSTVFFALWTIYTYLNISSLKGGVVITVSMIIALVLLLALWIIGAAAMYLLWRPVSTTYIKASSGTAR